MNAQIVLCIYDLDQQRETVAVTAAKQLPMLIPYFRKLVSGKAAIFNRAVTAWMCGDSPAFSGMLACCFIMALVF